MIGFGKEVNGMNDVALSECLGRASELIGSIKDDAKPHHKDLMQAIQLLLQAVPLLDRHEKTVSMQAEVTEQNKKALTGKVLANGQ